MENAPITAATVESVQNKLQALFDELPDHEKPVLEALLAHAADGGRQSIEDSGVEEVAIIIVGGRPAHAHIPLNPAVLVGLNPQPLPPRLSEDREQPE